jgi:peptide/nickel transport system substrate-binding protein
MRRSLRSCAPLLALGLALSACTSAADSRADDTLRVVGPQEIHSLDPAASDGVFTRLEVAETLVTADEAGEITPGLATGWEVDRKGTTWTFELVPEVTFHDGSPLTPEAAVAALEHTAAEAASPLSDAPIEEIRPTEDGLEVALTAPYPALPAVLTHYSASILAPGSYDADGHVTEVIGTGPYRIEKLRLPASVDVVRFSDWRGEPPAIERINFESAGRAEARALTASSRQADVVFRLEPAGVQRVEATDGVAMASVLQPRTLLLKVNLDHPVLGDVEVRRALSMALDREAMARAVLREPDLGATQLLPPSLEQWTAAVAPLPHGPVFVLLGPRTLEPRNPGTTELTG